VEGSALNRGALEMSRALLVLLFLVLYSAQTLGLDLSLVPGISVKNAFLYLIFAAVAIEAAVTQQRKPELMSVLGPFALYVLWAVAMWLAAVLIMDYRGYDLRQSLISLKNGPIEHFMVLLIFFYAVADTRHALWVLRSLLWIVIVGNLITVMDALNMPDLGLIHLRDDGRVGGPIGSSNEYAYFMAVMLPLIVALYWTEKGVKKLLAGAGIIVSAVAFLMSVSRGGIVGLVAGAILGAILLRKLVPLSHILRWAAAGAFLGGLALAGAFLADYGTLLVDRFGQLQEGDFDATSGRSVIWARLLGLMLEHPASFISGFGWWAYQAYQAMGLRYVTHSTYLEILFNLGIIGLTLFLAVGVSIIRTLRAGAAAADGEARPFLIASVIGFLGLLVALSFGNLYTPWLYLWALAGITLRIALTQMSDASEAAARAPAPWPPMRKAAISLPHSRGAYQ
jgi:putative inorganic carbon (hco3(-)) transporter